MPAPTIVAGATSGSNAANTLSVVVALPAASFADGDTVYIAIASDQISQTFTTPARFSALYAATDIPTVTPTATAAVFKQANIVKANETLNGANYEFTVAVGTTERQAWFVWAVNGDGGIDVQATNTSGSSATATIPAITTLTANCLVFGIVLTDQVSTPHGTATGYTKVGEVSAVSGASVSLFWQTVASAGAIGSQNVTITSEQWLGLAFAIKEAVTAITGSLAVTLANATLVATGQLAIVGGLTRTLDNATLSAAGQLAIVGSLTRTLDNATLAATGTLISGSTGSLAVTLANATIAATGVLAIKGSLAVTLANATIAATGSLPIVGTLARTLDNATLVATGVSASGATGSLVQTLANATLSATGQLTIAGSLIVTLQDATISSAGGATLIILSVVYGSIRGVRPDGGIRGVRANGNIKG